MVSAEEQELIVYEAYHEQKHEHGEEHHHPRPLAVLREHAQLENTTQEKFVNEVLSYKHSQASCKKIHEDFESDESCVWRISENNLKNQATKLGKMWLYVYKSHPFYCFNFVRRGFVPLDQQSGNEWPWEDLVRKVKVSHLWLSKCITDTHEIQSSHWRFSSAHFL